MVLYISNIYIIICVDSYHIIGVNDKHIHIPSSGVCTCIAVEYCPQNVYVHTLTDILYAELGHTLSTILFVVVLYVLIVVLGCDSLHPWTLTVYVLKRPANSEGDS